MGMGLHFEDYEYDRNREKDRLKWISPMWLIPLKELLSETVVFINKSLGNLVWKEESFKQAERLVGEMNVKCNVESLPYRNWRTDICLDCKLCDYNTIKAILPLQKFFSRMKDDLDYFCYQIAGENEQQSRSNALVLRRKMLKTKTKIEKLIQKTKGI